MPDDTPRLDQQRADAAAALRRLGHAFMRHEVNAEVLERIVEATERTIERIEATPPRKRDLLDIKQRMFDVEIPDGGRVSHFDECFVSGSQNPMGIAIEVRREGDEAVADVHLGAAFEGAPGRSHGGIVAAVFDDVCGYLTTLHRSPAFTGSLTVNYLAATPIEQPLEFRARVVGRDGRRMLVSAEARAGERVIATADATFITVELSAFRP